MVLHTPDANTVTVAEHTVAFIGALTKHYVIPGFGNQAGKV